MRRRIQAVPIPGASSSFGIGVSLTPISGPAPVCATGGTATPSGPVVIVAQFAANLIDSPIENTSCSWIVLMRGVSDLSTVVWSLTWDGMDADQIVYYGALDTNVIGIMTGTFDIYWIDVTCTIDGLAYTTRIGAERDSGDTAACSF